MITKHKANKSTKQIGSSRLSGVVSTSFFLFTLGGTEGSSFSTIRLQPELWTKKKNPIYFTKRHTFWHSGFVFLVHLMTTYSTPYSMGTEKPNSTSLHKNRSQARLWIITSNTVMSEAIRRE